MNLPRRLTEGVGAWLHFEMLCNRRGLFGEAYLSSAIGQVLTAEFGNRVHAELDHPVLAPQMIGKGRRPAIDFAYCDPYPEIRVAIETKWAGSSHTTPASIVRDLVRLELVAFHCSAQCIFVLAGMKSKLDQLFRLQEFSGPPNEPRVIPILNTVRNAQTGLSLLPDPPYRIPFLKRVFADWPDVEVPHKIITRRTDPFPGSCKTNQFQVYAWDVMPAVNRKVFSPTAHKHYGAGKKTTV